ncbi:helicase-exonuclease AddAB subunit AddA [Ohessyouella blattaphilus]|uniref:DNA 3'-5' helicase n=1 Tax=Ohessyouella blattaphilus TaxID=2949333 RepID=A0ABT1ELW4_9FIRM|nr:helicase-exonuclease AddAB subunit AddA [Ohessyouella blattaphilus]MCP1110701.1 helicase-exonuclease AddAB subunit AddA [Ohessyouella blattaphilus]MCR8564095.1 helicase-exonuclease AddAB subunit AddA [Ohessyouella blattaphilus]
MAIKYTKEQQNVIDYRDRNILVSAAAGSGKTAVLVARIIDRVTDKTAPFSVSELLVVTFTEAAASEMKARIGKAIEEALAADPDNQHLKEEAILINTAAISTIHTFCLNVIKDHFHEIDLDPTFRVAEGGELTLLQNELFEELLEEEYESGSPAFMNFALAYGGKRDDGNLIQMLTDLYLYARSFPDDKGWLKMAAALYDCTSVTELEASPLVRQIVEQTHLELTACLEMYEEALALTYLEGGPAPYQETLEQERDYVLSLLGLKSYEELNTGFRQLTFGKIGVVRNSKQVTYDGDLKVRVKALRDAGKGVLERLLVTYYFQNTQEMLDDFKISHIHVKEIVRLVLLFGERFAKRKRELGIIDFSDMEHFALDILTRGAEADFAPSQVAEGYRKRFKEIMIDEYQDSNHLQEAIFGAVAGDYNTFMVGDVKQSIYRFRLARPELFVGKYNRYSLAESKEQRIDLHKNFRSSKEVIDTVNYLFKRLMTEAIGSVNYDEGAALVQGREFAEDENRQTEVCLIDGSGSREADALALEASQIAQRIKGLRAQNGANYRDIVILLRSVKGVGERLRKELSARGIPAYVTSRSGYFKTREIRLLLDYLKIIDNGYQDIPLAAVLLSYFGKMTETELAQIKSHYPQKSFSEAVSSYIEEGEDLVAEKLNEILWQIAEFRREAKYMPIHEVLSSIIMKTGYLDYVQALPGGQQRQANVLMLLEKARSFDASSFKGIYHFIHYIDQLERYNVDEGEAGLTDENAEVVRIMSIHQSKGLEFPYVFVSALGNRLGGRSSNPLAKSVKLGIGIDMIDTYLGVKQIGLIKNTIEAQERLESLGEELRVLYVAFTRAEKKLILTGFVSDYEKKFGHLERTPGTEASLPYHLVAGVSTYLDILLPVLLGEDKITPVSLAVLPFGMVREEEDMTVLESYFTQESLLHLNTEEVYDQSLADLLEAQTSFVYPHQEETKIKSKISVSELKKLAYAQAIAEEEDEDSVQSLIEEPVVNPLIPKFMKKEEALSGALRGDAYHRVFELLDYTREYDDVTITQHLSTWVSEGALSEQEAAVVAPADIVAFLQSAYGKAMQKAAKAGKLYKEKAFFIARPAAEVYGVASDEWTLIQGIIDVYYEDPEGLTILDYKTDRVTDVGELKTRYQEQLHYYGLALEQITGKKVKEKIIYSVTLQEVCSV